MATKRRQYMWSSQLAGLTPTAAEGKTLGGVWEDGQQLRARRLFNRESGAALDQAALTGGLDEPRIAQERIAQVAGRIAGLSALTGDALYADANLCQAIVNRGKDYVAKLKKSAPTASGCSIALRRPRAAGTYCGVSRPGPAGTTAGLGLRRTGGLLRFPGSEQRDNDPPDGAGRVVGSGKGERAVRSEQPAGTGFRAGALALLRGQCQLYADNAVKSCLLNPNCKGVNPPE